MRTASNRVLISYSRSDGEEFATQLRERLEHEEPELTIWQDRVAMEGGVGWWKQVMEALDSVKFMVLVITPAALRSTTVQKEWRYARQQGVCVYPVIADFDAELNFEVLPRWMRKAHFYNLDKEWGIFVRYLKRPCNAPRVPFMAPDLPDCFVERPDVSSPLIKAIINNSESSVALTTSLQGAGGLGKTTMAIAICHDEDIIETFDDGILWVTLGLEPRTLELLSSMHAALTGNRPDFIDSEDASYHLAKILEDRNCLVVVDDVWDPTHLKHFLRGGKGCTRLITTRMAEVALMAKPYRLDEMTTGQAVRLLSDRIESAEAEPEAWHRIAVTLGEWPLLLCLANAQLRRRIAKADSVQGALDNLEKRFMTKGITAFDRRHAKERQDAFAKTIELSLELLSPPEIQQFYEMAVFPEDEDVQLDVIGALWGIDEFDVEAAAEVLDDVSLAEFNVQNGTLRLHDAIREFLQLKSENHSQMHSRMANALMSETLATSSYAWRWLPYHLIQAGRQPQLESLLLDLKWLQGKLLATDVGSVAADFDLLALDSDLRMIQEALRLSAAPLTSDPYQLAAQLCARLIPDRPQITEFVTELKSWRGTTWLKPLDRLLMPPGGSLVAALVGHEGPVLDVCLIPGNELAMTASADGTVGIWEWRRGRLRRRLIGHHNRVRSACVTRDGTTAATISEDQSVRLWDVEQGRLLQSIKIHANLNWRIMSARQEASEICYLGAASLQLSNGNPGQLSFDARYASDQLHDFVYLADDSVIVREDANKLVHLDRQTQAVTFEDHRSSPIRCIASASDSMTAVSVTIDGLLELHDMSRDPPARRCLSRQAFRSASLALSADGQWVASGADDGKVYIWNVNKCLKQHTLQAHYAPVNSVCFSDDARFVLSGSDDHTVYVWDLTRKPIEEAHAPHSDAVVSVSISPDNTLAFSTSDHRELLIWDLTNGKLAESLTGPGAWIVKVENGDSFAVMKQPGGRLHSFLLESIEQQVTFRNNEMRTIRYSISAEKTLLFDSLGCLSVRHTRTNECLLRVSLDGGVTREAVLSNDGCQLLVHDAAGRIHLHDLASGQKMPLPHHSHRTFAVANDGSNAFGYSNGEIRVLNSKGEKIINVHSDALNCLAFSTDCHWLASASEDRSIALIDLRLGEAVACFYGDAPMRSCDFGPDCRTLMAGDAIGKVHRFEVVKEKLAQ